MVSVDYLKNDLCLAMDLMIAGFTSTNNERLIMRAALYILTSLYVNITNQISKGIPVNDLDEDSQIENRLPDAA